MILASKDDYWKQGLASCINCLNYNHLFLIFWLYYFRLASRFRVSNNLCCWYHAHWKASFIKVV